MRAEELVALAAAQGVDLIQAAREGTPPAKRDVILKRFASGRRAPILLEPATNRARGTPSPSIDRPEWTLAEIGQAAAGVPEIYFQAACYAFAGHHGYFWPLQKALLREANELRRRDNWPEEIADIHGINAPYLGHLAKLVLDEDAHPSLFAVSGQLYSIYLRISEKTWEKSVSDRFMALKIIWMQWLGDAFRIMQPRLSQQADADSGVG